MRRAGLPKDQLITSVSFTLRRSGDRSRDRDIANPVVDGSVTPNQPSTKISWLSL
jgi:hypothetical protein